MGVQQAAVPLAAAPKLVSSSLGDQLVPPKVKNLLVVGAVFFDLIL